MDILRASNMNAAEVFVPSAMPVFDTYKYINTLKAAGFTEVQAEAQSSVLVGAFDANIERLATAAGMAVLMIKNFA